MKKLQYFSLLLLLLAMLGSCSGDRFKVDGNLVNLKGKSLRVVFYGDSGIVDEWVDIDEKGKFTYKGESSQPVIVTFLNSNKEPLMMVVAANGDHLKVKGDAGKALGLKVKGNKLNEDWQLFRDEHGAFYTDPNPSRLDAAIEKYVRENPTDMLSTVLLMADYSNYTDQEKVEALLNGIDIKARPASLTEAFMGNPMGKRNVSVPRLITLTLVKHGGEFEEIKLMEHISLINLWANPQTERKAVNIKLQNLLDSSNGSVNIIDVLAESDTLNWHQTIAGEDRPHYWAPGGPLEQGIQLLGATIMPWYAVTDSTGLVAYSGPHLDDAIKKALELAAIRPDRDQ